MLSCSTLCCRVDGLSEKLRKNGDQKLEQFSVFVKSQHTSDHIPPCLIAHFSQTMAGGTRSSARLSTQPENVVHPGLADAKRTRRTSEQVKADKAAAEAKRMEGEQSADSRQQELEEFEATQKLTANTTRRNAARPPASAKTRKAPPTSKPKATMQNLEESSEEPQPGPNKIPVKNTAVSKATGASNKAPPKTKAPPKPKAVAQPKLPAVEEENVPGGTEDIIQDIVEDIVDADLVEDINGFTQGKVPPFPAEPDFEDATDEEHMDIGTQLVDQGGEFEIDGDEQCVDDGDVEMMDVDEPGSDGSVVSVKILRKDSKVKQKKKAEPLVSYSLIKRWRTY